MRDLAEMGVVTSECSLHEKIFTPPSEFVYNHLNKLFQFSNLLVTKMHAQLMLGTRVERDISFFYVFDSANQFFCKYLRNQSL